jgi:hypothetical protein
VEIENLILYVFGCDKSKKKFSKDDKKLGVREMKKLLTIITLLLVGFAACTENADLITQDSSLDRHSLSKKGKKDKNDPVLDFYTASKEIDGKKGGKITLKVSMDKSTGQKSEVKLNIPKGAFEGTELISFTISPGSPDIVFSPHGLVFEKPVKLDLKLENFWFDKKDKEYLDFGYFDDNGNLKEDVEYDDIKFDGNKNYVKVKKALLSHYSRFKFFIR